MSQYLVCGSSDAACRCQYCSNLYHCITVSSLRLCVCVCWQSEIASLKADNERLQTVVAEKAGIDGAVQQQTAVQSAAPVDAMPGNRSSSSS